PSTGEITALRPQSSVVEPLRAIGHKRGSLIIFAFGHSVTVRYSRFEFGSRGQVAPRGSSSVLALRFVAVLSIAASALRVPVLRSRICAPGLCATGSSGRTRGRTSIDETKTSIAGEQRDAARRHAPGR